jgi:hypothetical protein
MKESPSPTPANPFAKVKTPFAAPFSLILRLRYLFHWTEFAVFCCEMKHPSPFVCAFYLHATSN